MVITLDFDDYEKKQFKSSYSLDDLKWSYFNVYYLLDLKYIVRAYIDNRGFKTISDLHQYCLRNGIKSQSGDEWTDRKLLEDVNCLKKIGILRGNVCRSDELFKNSVGKELTHEDLLIFKYIFESYERFKDFHAFFYDSNNIKNKVVYASKSNSRFFNRFFVTDSQKEYFIKDDLSYIMRFWDVYLKWGTELGVLQKISVKALGLSPPLSQKDMIIVYFTEIMPPDFSILNFCQNEYGPDYVYIPQLYWMIACKYRFDIKTMRDRLIKECLLPNSKYRLQRTSSVFVNEREAEIFPLIGNQFMSHLLKL